jgi:hypothetical protein
MIDNVRSSLAGMPLSVSTVFQSMRSQATERGELHVALTDFADNFLNDLQPLP